MNSLQIIFDKHREFADLAEKRATIFPEISKALDIVRKFIVDKKLIIYGGMAIDLNLKKNGHVGIYEEDIIPDYDFMSPDFYNDSNELARILQTEGFHNVSAINTLHITSRKVRVNYVPVADITYIPENIYKNLPYVQINDIKVIHPDFQRMDMHRAFCIPFSNPPKEVILHRLNKDQKRFRLIHEHCPIKCKSNAFATVKLQNFKVNRKYLQNAVIGGITAYAIYLKIAKLMVNSNSNLQTYVGKNADIIKNNLDSVFNLEISFLDAIEIQLPADFRFNIITEHFEDLVSEISSGEKIKEVEYYNKYLDNLRPRTIIVGNYEIYDNKGELLPCYNLQKVINVMGKLVPQLLENIKDANHENMYIALPSHTLLYFLQKSFENTSQCEFYKCLYLDLIKIINVAELVYSQMQISDPELAQRIYKYMPFFMPVKTYGEFNISPEYISMMRNQASAVNHTEQPNLRPPAGYFPEKNNEWPEFNPNSSFLYTINGQKTEEFKPLQLI